MLFWLGRNEGVYLSRASSRVVCKVVPDQIVIACFSQFGLYGIGVPEARLPNSWQFGEQWEDGFGQFGSRARVCNLLVGLLSPVLVRCDECDRQSRPTQGTPPS